MHDRRVDVFIVVLLLALVGLIFGPTVTHEFVRYDDQTYVTDNPLVQKGLTAEGFVWAFREAGAANYTPLTWLSHMLDCQLFGLQAGRHHLTNVLLHAINSILLYFLLKNLTSQRWPSAFVAILFAAHPMHVESVAWVSERKDLLSTLLMFLTIAAYARFARKPRVSTYLLVLFLYALALLAKPMAVTLPVLLLLLDYWPFGRITRARVWPLILEKIPLIVLAIADGIATIFAQHLGGAMRTLDQFPLTFRFTNAIVSYARYIGKMFWPTNLAVFYPPPKAWPIGIVIFCGLVLVVTVLIAIVKARSKPYVFVGIFWFAVTLLPVIGLIQVGRQAMADRYTYIPYIGLFIAIAFLLKDAMAAHPRKRDALLAGTIIVTVACALFAYDQVQNWKDTFTLFSHALRVTNDNAVAHVQVGNDFLRHNNFPVAEEHYREAIRIDPRYALGQMNVGHLLARRGEFAEAVPHYEMAIRSKPELPEAHLGLGIALIELNDPQQAASELREALRLKPTLTAAQDALTALQRPTTSTTSRPKINSATE